MTEEIQRKYPEHAKLDKIQKESQVIGEFLEWLGSVGLWISEYKASYRGAEEVLVSTQKSTSQILAQYFNIDQNKIDQEKREMLEECRRVLNDARGESKKSD
jgi:hypothetical protein